MHIPFVQNITKITTLYTNTNWKSGDGFITLKTQTAIFFSQDRSFHSFGYEAEQNYVQFVDHNQSKEG